MNRPQISQLFRSLTLASAALFWTSPIQSAPAPSLDSVSPHAIPEPEIIDAPGLDKRELVGPLSDVIDHLSPKDDGWDTEAVSEAASAQLYRLAALLTKPNPTPAAFSSIAAESFSTSWLRPCDQSLDLQKEIGFNIRKWNPDSKSSTTLSLPEACRQFRAAFAPEETLQIATKLYKVQPKPKGVTSTDVLVEVSGKTKSSRLRQINTEWRCTWQHQEGQPLLTKIELLHYQEVTRVTGDGETLFSDQTKTALGGNISYENQLLFSTDHWRARFPQSLGLDVVANVGFLLADLNGDDLEDLYFCQQGGLPNLLFLRQTNGTFRDASEGSGVDWMDFSPSALAIDLDKDGDRDLVIALQFKLLLMRNDGKAKFELAHQIPLSAQTFSISAADYDLDGDLDLCTCGYNPSVEELVESGALGAPTPFHDANNGGRNTLLKNVGAFEFRNATAESGMKNNTRFSFAAAWEDYDQDGDPDLYVANDYGRNNLYRNDQGQFIDVAGELKVEDMSSGMSVSWGDLNRDGRSDIYVSNMFSSAGNRITFQEKFQDGQAGDALNTFQRFARGNALFQATPEGGFADISPESGATMARWAWGSRLADLNNDGWEDILAANGFISTPDTGDL